MVVVRSANPTPRSATFSGTHMLHGRKQSIAVFLAATMLLGQPFASTQVACASPGACACVTSDSISTCCAEVDANCNRVERTGGDELACCCSCAGDLPNSLLIPAESGRKAKHGSSWLAGVPTTDRAHRQSLESVLDLKAASNRGQALLCIWRI